MEKCYKCGTKMAGVQYSPDSPNGYEGISEYLCMNENCGVRIGRWTRRILREGDEELRFGGPARAGRFILKDK